MFEDLQQDFKDFGFLYYPDQVRFLHLIRDRIDADPEGFKAYMLKLNFNDSLTYRSIFYNALRLNPEAWKNYILSEVKSLIQRQEQHSENEDPDIECIYQLATQMGFDELSFDQECMRILYPKLTSSISYLRKQAFKSICWIQQNGNYRLNKPEIHTLQRCLEVSATEDKMWYYQKLEEIDLLPRNARLTFWDKIMGWFDSY